VCGVVKGRVIGFGRGDPKEGNRLEDLDYGRIILI